VFDLTFYILVFTIFSYVTVGFIVIANNPRTAANRILLSFSLLAGLWALAILIIYVNDNPAITLFWIRASHALGVLAPWHILALISSLYGEDPLHDKKLRTALAVSIIMACIAVSPYLIIGLEEPADENRLIYSNFTYLFIVFLFGMIVNALWQVFGRLKRSRGRIRIQINYFFTGLLISALLISAVNLILPIIGIIS